MDTMTISQVSKGYGISTRMLRYYEQAGLIESFRRDDYAYRMYDKNAQQRLSQILILRRLRIPVKQIKTILGNARAVEVIRIFEQNIREVDVEINALSTIREILIRFVSELEKTADLPASTLLTTDNAIVDAISALSLVSINFKEEKTMDDLKKATDTLTKLNDVRIIYLPPATVAASHFIGDEPEMTANQALGAFVHEKGLTKRMPSIRHFGFNHPNPVDETGFHGYEAWVTIPDDMEVPAPLEKKHFAGGVYAAHMIQMGNFGDWDLMVKWIEDNEKYEFAGDFEDQEHMCGLLEETLNYVSRVSGWDSEPGADMQLDLLMPIRLKQNG